MATDDLSREIILDHYQNPRNHGRLDQPTLANRGHNPLCGDEIELSVAIDEPGSVLREIRFSGRGCSISQASASMLCERIEGLPLEQARAIGRDDVLEMIGLELGPVRLKCALLALKTMKVGLWGLGAAADLDDDA
jgi:nitrogen fixation NifU-like protein